MLTQWFWRPNIWTHRYIICPLSTHKLKSHPFMAFIEVVRIYLCSQHFDIVHTFSTALWSLYWNQWICTPAKLEHVMSDLMFYMSVRIRMHSPCNWGCILYWCLVCPRCPANAIQMSRATLDNLSSNGDIQPKSLWHVTLFSNTALYLGGASGGAS